MKVLKQGLYTSVQDLGRTAHAKWGVPQSGCMDRNSARIANRLLGNHDTDAVLECTMMGPEVEFGAPTFIAVSGAQFELYLNGELIEMNKAHRVAKGDQLVFGKLKQGLRGYLAVAGGFQTEKVLGSRSYYFPLTSGGRVVQGQSIPYKERSRITGLKDLKASECTPLETNTIEARRGPEFDWLSEAQKKALETTDFKVSNRNNRMAYQLEPNIGELHKNRITCPVVPGTVQLTPEGSLFVLMRDGQTTGGYPRVLQLFDSSLDALAQMRTGSSFTVRLQM